MAAPLPLFSQQRRSILVKKSIVKPFKDFGRIQYPVAALSSSGYPTMPTLLKRVAAIRAKTSDAITSREGLDRSKGWAAIFVSSTVVLIVFSDLLSGKFHNGKKLYIVSCCAIAMILGFLFTAASYIKRLKTKLYGNFVEASFAVVNMALWSIAMGILQSPKNNFASTVLTASTLPGTDSILNANLYFASWFFFAASAAVLVSVFKEIGTSQHVSWTSITANINRWFLLLVSSLVVLVSASLLNTNTSRTHFAVSVGVITSALPFLVICSTFPCFKYRAGVKLQILIAFICVGLYCFEVAFVTSPKGPGHSVSNLYFSSWISFILSISLFMNILDEYIAESGITTNDGEPQQTTNPGEGEDEPKSEVEPKAEDGHKSENGDVLRV